MQAPIHVLLRTPTCIPELSIEKQANAVSGNESNIYSTIKKEYETLVKQLLFHEIKVHQDFPTSSLQTPFESFPASWIYLHPDGSLIIMSISDKSRRNERLQFIIEWVCINFDTRRLIDLREYEKQNYFLEGTDSIVFNHDTQIAYACESKFTNIKLFEALCYKLNYQPVSFIAYQANGDIFNYTNEILNITSYGIFFCADAIDNSFERSMVLNSLKASERFLMEIPLLHAKEICSNLIELCNPNGERFTVISQSAHDLLHPSHLNIINTYSSLVVLENERIQEYTNKGINSMMAKLF